MCVRFFFAQPSILKDILGLSCIANAIILTYSKSVNTKQTVMFFQSWGLSHSKAKIKHYKVFLQYLEFESILSRFCQQSQTSLSVKFLFL